MSEKNGKNSVKHYIFKDHWKYNLILFKGEKHINKNSFSNNKVYERSNLAVVGIVTALLLVGLFITVLSVVQTVYVPQWMEENEAVHLKEIKNQFMNLKFALDIQVYNPSSNEMKLTVPMTLGSKKVPYFLSENSYGELLLENDNSQIIINTNNSSFDSTIHTLSYQSYNSYFPDQKFTYDAGAVILSQKQGALLMSSPFFSILENNESIRINWTIVNLIPFNTIESFHGKGTCSILIQYINNSEYQIQNISTIQIYSNHIDIWMRYLNTTLSESGLVKNNDYLISNNSDSISLQFLLVKDVICNYKKTNINVQFNPNWIE